MVNRFVDVARRVCDRERDLLRQIERQPGYTPVDPESVRTDVRWD